MSYTHCIQEDCIRDAGHAGSHAHRASSFLSGGRTAGDLREENARLHRDLEATIRERDALAEDEQAGLAVLAADPDRLEVVERLADALRQLGFSEAVISDVADGRSDIDGRVPNVVEVGPPTGRLAEMYDETWETRRDE